MSIETKPRKATRALKAVLGDSATENSVGEVTLTDSAGQLDSDAYDLAGALREIQLRERRLRDELGRSQGHNVSLQAELQRLRAPEPELARLLLHNAKLETEFRKLERVTSEYQERLVTSERALELERQRADQERTEWAAQIQRESNRSEGLVRRYDELHQHCQSIIQEAESRRTSLEAQLAKAKETTHQLAQGFKESEDSVKRKEQLDLDRLLTEVQAREMEMQQLNQGLKEQIQCLQTDLDESRRDLTGAKFDKARVEARLKSLSEGMLVRSVQLGGSRNHLASVIRILESLQKSARDSIDGSAKTLGSKVLGLVIEQWRIEIDSLRKLDVMLAEIIEAQKKV